MKWRKKNTERHEMNKDAYNIIITGKYEIANGYYESVCYWYAMMFYY